MNNYKKRLLLLVATVAALAACAPAVNGPPEIIFDHSACAHCSMLISEPAYAAAYRINGVDKTFDDIGCLLTALGDEPNRDAAQLWFRDVHDGTWIAPDAATFFRSPSLRTPMAGGIVATANAVEMERLRADFEPTVYASLEALRDDYWATAAANDGRDS